MILLFILFGGYQCSIMSYYLFGNINDIIENYYGDIHFTKIIPYNDASGCYLDNVIFEMKKIIADADINYFKDCDYLLIVSGCCVPYNNVVFADHHKLLYELDELLKHVRYMIISSDAMSTIFDADMAICKDNYIRMNNIFHGLDWLRNVASGCNYKRVGYPLSEWIIQSIYQFQRVGCGGDNGMISVYNYYFIGSGVGDIIDTSGLSYHYDRSLTGLCNTTDYVRNKMCIFQKWVYAACEFYKQIFMGDGIADGEYIFIYVDVCGDGDVDSWWEGLIPPEVLATKKYFVWNSASIIGKGCGEEPYNKIFDKYEYEVCMFILMCKAAKIYHISTFDGFWKKDGLVNVAEDFWGRDVVRIDGGLCGSLC